jgi:hypothetical protein
MGIRVLGRWRNKSRFVPVELPDVGTIVRLGVDQKNFITSLEVVEKGAVRVDSSAEAWLQWVEET